jgi:hypothetical protein
MNRDALFARSPSVVILLEKVPSIPKNGIPVSDVSPIRDVVIQAVFTTGYAASNFAVPLSAKISPLLLRMFPRLS